MPNKEKFAQPWKKWARDWKKLTHPSRPCQKNIRDYTRFLKEAIKGKKEARALVFGATPEIRDMLAQFPQIEVTVVDINIEMILAMTELMKHKDKANEEAWLRSDWLRDPLKNNYYDVAFGDYIFENLPHKKQPLLFKRAHDLLKKNGYFITRFYADYPESKTRDFEGLVLDYIKQRPTAQNFENFWSAGLFYSNARKEHILGVNIFLEELKKYTKHPKIKMVYQKASELLPKDKEWTYFNWQRDKWMLEKYFILEKKAAEPKKSTAYNWGYVLKLKRR